MDSFIEALARRYRIFSSAMLAVLGIPTATYVISLLRKTAPAVWRRVETAAGLAPARLSAATGADLPMAIRLLRDGLGDAQDLEDGYRGRLE